MGASIKYERDVMELAGFLSSEEGMAYLREDGRDVLRHEIAQRLIEARVLHNLARSAVSRTAAGESTDDFASVNQLFAAELHQRLALTGMRIFGRAGQMLQREGSPLGGAFTHMFFDSIAATVLGGTTEIQRNVIATRGLGLPRE